MTFGMKRNEGKDKQHNMMDSVHFSPMLQPGKDD